MRNLILKLSAFLLFTFSSLQAREYLGKINRVASTNSTTSAVIPSPACANATSQAVLEINNVRALYLNAGDMFWDRYGSQLARYEIPKTTEIGQFPKFSLFAASIWLGGKERVASGSAPSLLMQAQTYGLNGTLVTYWPGPLNTKNSPMITRSECSGWNHHYKVTRKEVVTWINGGFPDVPDNIKYWPARNNPYLSELPGRESLENLDQNLAKFYDKNNDNIYDYKDGDFPLLPGTFPDTGRYAFTTNGCTRCADNKLDPGSGADEVIWWVCNDVGAQKLFPVPIPKIPAIGLEIQYEAFAYSASDPTNDMTFLRQIIINKGSYTMDSTYLAQFTDPDLGNYNDDYIGCDVQRGMGICYNGDDFDEGVQGYGFNPPSIAVDFFYGPFADANDGINNDKDPNGQIDEACESIIMSEFMYFNNSGAGIPDFTTDPAGPVEFYNYLKGFWKNGNPLRHDGSRGISVSPEFKVTKCAFPRDSDPKGTCCDGNGPCGTVWDEKSAGNPPGDRRFLISAGPFTLTPGAINEVTIGIVWAKATTGGSTGSFSLLLKADDLAQTRFDDCFSRLVGPFIPNVDIAENDGELYFSIIPDTIRKNPLMTTETYTEVYRRAQGKLNTDGSSADFLYRFQGYKVYQLADDKVTTGELNNPDRARLLDMDIDGDGDFDISGVMDKIDEVTEIRNIEFDADLNLNVPKVMVKGSNTGIFKSFKVAKDMFAPERPQLTNFKRYYYCVIPYAYNGWDANDLPYLQGNIEFKVFSATPHKVAPEDFGTVLNSEFGQTMQVTKKSGFGIGKNFIEVSQATEDAIVANGFTNSITYLEKLGPIGLKVYNPKTVKNGDFRLKLSSRIVATFNGPSLNANDFFKPGDILNAYEMNGVPKRIISSGPYKNENYRVLKNNSVIEKPGKAVVRRVVSQEGRTFVLDVDMQNECDTSFGTFLYHYDVIDAGRPSNLFVISTDTGLTFSSNRTPERSFKVLDFRKNDFWTLTEKQSGENYYSEQAISENTEQLIPEFGLAIRIQQGNTPGQLNYYQNPVTNGFIGSSIIYEDPEKPSVAGVNSGIWQTVRKDNAYAGETFQYSVDVNRALTKYLQGSAFPYICGKVISDKRPEKNPRTGFGTNADQDDGGPTYKADQSVDLWYTAGNRPAAIRPLSNTHNIDIVITSDKSKWTRCVVLQHDTLEFRQGALRPSVSGYQFGLTKRRGLPSVDKEGNPDNSFSSYPQTNPWPSRGMGWFPGYAIDLDKGIRLNMMFAESEQYGPKGKDLKWEPIPATIPSGFPPTFETDPVGGKNFVYVMNTAYDEGKKMEAAFDRLYDKRVLQKPAALRTNNIFADSIQELFLNNTMWSWVPQGVYKPSITQKGIRKVDETKTRIKLRIDRAFEAGSLSGTACEPPVFEFRTFGTSVDRNAKSTGKTAMDLIRVVPNPYYAYSIYENNQVDNRVKIVNIPTKCDISIYTLNGTLIRQYKIDQTNVQNYRRVTNGRQNQDATAFNEVTFQDWDLKNQLGIPIASGVYIIHIDGHEFGSKVLKWFGALRPIDLDSF